jgi:glycosyltransferase involved in cell wall biosynthesis
MISMIHQWKKQNKPLDFPESLPSGTPWPKISIITPSFNQGKYIEDTILSILLQGYPNIEHIIMDGGSTDETLEIVKSYEQSLTKIISEPDKGQSEAINKGMRIATGDILTWLNSDDMLAPGALAAIAMAFDVNDADLVAGVCHLFKDNRHFASHLTSCPNGPLKARELLDMEHYWQAGMYFYQPEVMFSRRIWEMAGGYVDENLQFCMDCELFLRFSKFKARLQVIGHPVAWFRYHDEQKTNDTSASPYEFKQVCEKFAQQEQIDLASNNDKGPVLIGRPLNIVMVNDIGFLYGAGIAHKRLSDALTMAGHNVTHFALGHNGKSHTEYSAQIERVTSEIDKLKPDLVICGNLHNFSPKADFLVQALSRWPVALCVHDLWLLTGKCPHPFDCGEYLSGCTDQCQAGEQYPILEKSILAETWLAKREALNNSNALLLCNSQWTFEMVQNTLKGERLSFGKLTMGVSPCFFERRLQSQARDYFNLPRDKFIILLASVNISDGHKGREALEQLDTIQDEGMKIISLGVSNTELGDKYPWLTQIGILDDPEIICKAYTAADVHISFSKTETLGQCFLEAAACGTPSIGYRSTGITDSVTEGVTGILVDLEDNLLEALLKIKENPKQKAALSTWATVHAENTRSLFLEYHSFYQALRASGLIQMQTLGRKIGFLANNINFSELSTPIHAVQMAPYLGTGWATISPKGILSTNKKSSLNFALSSFPRYLIIEVSAHWAIHSSLYIRILALGYYAFIRGDSSHILSRLKKLLMAKKKPLVVNVLLNNNKIGDFTLKTTKRLEKEFTFPESFIQDYNTLTFESKGGVVLSEIGVSSEGREIGFRLHKLALS